MIKISKSLQKEFVCNLKLAQKQEIGRAIKITLELQGLSGKERKRLLEEALNSRVCDLENTIEIKYE